MKYRIKKITQWKDTSYRIEERILFIWWEVDCISPYWYMPLSFDTEKEAKEWIKEQLSYNEEIIELWQNMRNELK